VQAAVNKATLDLIAAEDAKIFPQANEITVNDANFIEQIKQAKQVIKVKQSEKWQKTIFQDFEAKDSDEDVDSDAFGPHKNDGDEAKGWKDECDSDECCDADGQTSADLFEAEVAAVAQKSDNLKAAVYDPSTKIVQVYVQDPENTAVVLCKDPNP
jgi:hypothetical protein